MELKEIFSDSLRFPSNNWTKLLILGVFLVIGNLLVNQVYSTSLGNSTPILILGLVLSIIGLIVYLIAEGYVFDVLRSTINGINESPDFNFVNNLVEGIKVFVVEIVYFIIPFIITVILVFITGLLSVERLFGNPITGNFVDVSAVPILPIVIVSIVVLILFIIFGLFLQIAISRMADTGKLSEAFNFKEIYNTIGQIGWGNYIVWYIVLFLIILLIVIALGLVFGLLSLLLLIPVIGLIGIVLIFVLFIIVSLLLHPYIMLFSSRALGLLYLTKDSKSVVTENKTDDSIESESDNKDESTEEL
ncbi:DUF4013 domain-containing protein [Methanobrevibacter filiformis]|uniref:Glycerophosphoryl diester phosphodiesterase membrane domain-containing protein n=1 Tax=Methanobrevibacter filiformis TaxID=55758 RepID=A0A166AZH5_9EURY|nr:DUF4013 domain-containing protein [Methanobrevibacter filiformis]KZX12669.1 hypothetical protein MBFIL_10690 [Methanobrevibacter filiformis]